MIETPLNKVLNTMRQYVENIYEHDSEPMLNWKDIKLVLDEIERLSTELNTCMIERNNYLSKIDKAIELLEKENYQCPMSLTVEKAYIIEVEKINNVISILRGENNEGE